MTEERQDGTTANRNNGMTAKEVVIVPPKKRAGSARSAFARAGVGKGAQQSSTESAAVVVEAVAVDEHQEQEIVSKFTVLLHGEDAMDFDALALKVRRLTGGKTVKKSDMLRALIALASDDQTLTAQLAEELRKRQTRGQ